MDRRSFLRNAFAAGAVYGTGSLPGIVSSASAQTGFAGLNNRVVVNVMLEGGPDWRHVFAPAWSTQSGSYGNAFWNARSRSFSTGGTVDPNAKWADDYYHFSAGGKDFGILRTCDWLAQMYEDGNVAVVNNVVGSQNRDHAHSQLVLNQGNRSTGANDFGRSGWGGRLASVMRGNIVGLTSAPSEFCNGLHPSGDMLRYFIGNQVSARDTRSMSLYSADPNSNPDWDARGNVTRALETYYLAKAQEVAPTSPYARFVQQEVGLRAFGELIDERLSTLPEPAELQALYHWSGDDRLARANFGLQLRNLYDTLACSDILDVRVASMEYGGWDTHDSQAETIERNLFDVFGADRGMDRLWRNLPEDVKDKVVFVFAGEFGRQLVANGGGGTDHGRGTSYVMVGRSINGGVYGDMFPESELAKMNDTSPDIDGKTEFDHVLGSLCDWADSGSSQLVFPDRNSAMLEPGVNISGVIS